MLFFSFYFLFYRFKRSIVYNTNFFLKLARYFIFKVTCAINRITELDAWYLSAQSCGENLSVVLEYLYSFLFPACFSRSTLLVVAEMAKFLSLLITFLRAMIVT